MDRSRRTLSPHVAAEVVAEREVQIGEQEVTRYRQEIEGYDEITRTRDVPIYETVDETYEVQVLVDDGIIARPLLLGRQELIEATIRDMGLHIVCGKHFDAPRISGRLAFHRMGFELSEPHLDLCQVGRSLYRGAFGNCRLQTFERRLVDFHRADDLPGAECPQAFFSHLQGDSSLIPRVFEHNLFDVLTMPAVAAKLGDVWLAGLTRAHLAAVEALPPQAREVHVVGGLHPELPWSYMLDMLRGIKKIRPRGDDVSRPVAR